MNLEKARKVKEMLWKYILNCVPFASHVCGCGVSTQNGEFCIKVNLLKRLPEGVVLPSHFMAVRVVPKVVGEIKKQKM